MFFNGNSGTGASVWNTAISLTGLDCTGSKNPVTHNGITLTLSAGNLVLPTGAGGTYTAVNTSSLFSITGTSGTQQITTNGFLPGALTLNGVGGTFQLQDNLAMLVNAATTITLTNGTFACQTFTVTTGRFSAANSNTKVLTGSGLWTLLGTGTIWSLTATGTTITGFTSNVTATATSATARSFTCASGMTLQGTLTVTANSSGGMFSILATMTLGTLSVAGPNCIRLPTGGSVITLTNAPTIAGSSGSAIGFVTDSPATLSTISCASGTPTFSWCAFRDITVQGGATFNATNSFDLGNNVGFNTLSAPSGGSSAVSVIGS